MPDEPVPVTMAEIAERLKAWKRNNNSVVLFLGSRAGGLFRCPNLHETMLPFSNRNLEELSQTVRFAEYYAVLKGKKFSDSETYSILTSCLNGFKATEADIYLAEFVKQEYFDWVISTNIDDILEQAFMQVGMEERQEYHVFIPGYEANTDGARTEKGSICQVIKSFGDLSSRKYNILKRGLPLENDRKLQNLVERSLVKDVLVIGWDPVWDGDMGCAFPLGAGSIWFVNEDKPLHSPFIELASRGRQIQYITGKDGGYENFWKILYGQLYREMPPNYQVIHTISTQLQTIQREIQKTHDEQHSTLHEIFEELKALRSKVAFLHDIFSDSSSNDESL